MNSTSPSPSESASSTPEVDWQARREASRRMAWKLGAMAVLLFVLAIALYRPF